MIDQITTHANARLRQRGITRQVVDYLVEYGDAIPAPGGAMKIFINKRQSAKIVSALKKNIQKIEKANGVIIIQKDGSFLTGYHKS